MGCDMLKVGEAIRKARRDKGYTLEQLANKAQINYASLQKWETGKVYPNIYNLIPIADVLNISLDKLVGRTMQNEKEK